MRTNTARFERVWLMIILIISALLRTYHLGHSIGIHPDERHMIMVAEKLSWQDLNPHSFAYGSFVYYLLWMTSRPLGLISPYFTHYDGLFWVGRVICVLFGLIGIWLTAKLTKAIYNDALTALFAAALLGFNPFHVQLSRFYTVDVILTTLCTGALLCMVRILQTADSRSSWWWLRFLGCGAWMGLAVASKITALFLLAPLGITWMALHFRGRKLIQLRYPFMMLLAVVTMVVTFAGVEPYSWIDVQSFIKDSNEQTTLVRGEWRAPYTIQFAHTLPYLYHIKQFFFTMGWPVAFAVCVGCFESARRLWNRPRAEEVVTAAYLIPAFIFIAGFQVKFPRYLLPLYPVLFAYAASSLTTLVGSFKAVASRQESDTTGAVSPHIHRS